MHGAIAFIPYLAAHEPSNDATEMENPIESRAEEFVGHTVVAQNIKFRISQTREPFGSFLVWNDLR